MGAPIAIWLVWQLMLASLSSVAVQGGILLAAGIWAAISLIYWAPRSKANGGRWYLAAIVWLVGPVILTIIKFYPPDMSGPLPTLGRFASTVGYVLGGIAILTALRTPRKSAGWVAGGAFVYYAALLLSSGLGAAPALVEPLLVTPLLVLPFALHGGYTYTWFLRVARSALRTILLLSAATLAIAPDIAFNTLEARQVFGVSRFEGIATHPNTLGIIAVIAFLLEVTTRGRWWWSTLALISLVFAQSNTATIALLVAVLFMTGTFGKAIRWSAAAVILVTAVVGIAEPSIGARLVEGFTPTTLDGLNGRTTIWSAALSGLQSNLLFGYGPTFLSEDYRASVGLGYFGAAAQAHNEFIQTLGVAGLMGVAALVFFAATLIFGQAPRNTTDVGIRRQH